MGATLYIHPISPFARKAMVLNRVADLGVMEIVPERVAGRGYVADHNPLGKIPALVTDEGTLIVDSPVVCEWLDARGHRWLPDAPDPLAARSLHAVGDGLSQAVYDYRYETVRDTSLHWGEMIARKTEAIRQTVQWLETQVPRLAGPIAGASWGGLAVATALDYADFRATHVPWRDLAPDLARWHASVSSSDAFQDCNGYGAAA